MTWTAPEIARDEPPEIADERQMLDAWLDYHRNTLLTKCAGLSADKLRRRAVEPSSMSLLGLVRHLSEVERSWFRRRVAGLDLPEIYVSDDEPDADFDGVDSANAEADFHVFETEVRLAREATASLALDHVFHHPRRNIDMTLRWVYVHMIEEYARHNGHADLLRERIDGHTGE
jgi:uncharacterized damage-inducible protein DinB